MWHAWGRREIHLDFWLKNLGQKDRLEDLDVYSRVILKCRLKKLYERAWT